jgi:uncharacterized protein (DUF849 family)
MNREVIVTCAVTGAGMPVKHRPVLPEDIGEAAVEAARAGAAAVHIHVRNPETGGFSRSMDRYRAVVEHIRTSGVDVVLNLTGGMGGEVYFDDDDLSEYGEKTDLVPAVERIAHVEELLPDICSLDCGVACFGERNVNVYTPQMARRIITRLNELGVKPEIEVFDLSGIAIARSMIVDGLIDDPPWFQLCLGIPTAAPADARTMQAMADSLPSGALFSAFGLAQMEMPMVAQAVLLGGHVRVGLEDNLYLAKGVPATNAQLVARAVEIIERLGARAVTAAEARQILHLPKR